MFNSPLNQIISNAPYDRLQNSKKIFQLSLYPSALPCTTVVSGQLVQSSFWQGGGKLLSPT